MSKSQEAFNFINECLANGRTVHVASCTRITEVTPKTAARWAKSGNVLFKMLGDDLKMASGKGFVTIASGDIIYNRISAA